VLVNRQQGIDRVKVYEDPHGQALIGGNLVLVLVVVAFRLG